MTTSTAVARHLPKPDGDGAVKADTQSIRYAKVTDASALADLAETTFRENFGISNTAEDLEHHCRASYGEALQLAEISDPTMAGVALSRLSATLPQCC